jgi:ABC-type glycerol-3-phosphate transport system permease component
MRIASTRTAPRAASRARQRVGPAGLAVNAALLLAVVLTAIPYVYMISAALKPNGEIYSYPITLWPRQPILTNFADLLTHFPYGRWYLNTAVMTIGRTAIALVVSSLAGFAFAKYEFRFKTSLFVAMLLTLTLPPVILLVPQFELMVALGWFNSFWALILPQAVGAFGVFLMRQYTLGVPRELMDAARIDGASELGIYRLIVLPLVRPGLAVLGILTVTASWNDFVWPLIVATRPSMFVLNVGLGSLIGPYNYEYGMLLAGSFLATLPIVAVFLFFSRQLIEGLTAGAFKGA